MALQTFVLDVQPGTVDVLVDGNPVPGVESINLQAAPGQVPVLTLQGPALGTVTGAGTVQLVDPDGTTELVTFLRAIDPVTLEQQALNRDDLGMGPASTTVAILAQLLDYAEGR